MTDKSEKVKRILVLPGDGIGKEVTQAVMPVFQELNIPLEIEYGDIGWEYWCQEANPVPERTWQQMKTVDAVLLGAITSQPLKRAITSLAPQFQADPPEYVSPVIQLRQQCQLYANVRPCFDVFSADSKFNFCVIRENTEGLYAGLDYHPIPLEIQSLLAGKQPWMDYANEDMSASVRIQSYAALKRVYQFAFSYAKNNGLNKVTLADKPNVLRKSGYFSKMIFDDVAKDYPDIKHEILNVDAVALWMVRRPEQFGVIVAENMFADILSDLAAGVMGGLGFAPSANIGNDFAYFEPVHGSAPNVRAGRANPSAMFLTVAMLLQYLGLHEKARIVRFAVEDVIREGVDVTYDLGGKASTQVFAHAVIKRAKKIVEKKYECV